MRRYSDQPRRAGSGHPLVNRMLLSLASLILLTIPFSPALDAQYYPFGRNKVQYESFDFRVLKTPHFDVHFYPEQAFAIEDVARMAERWYERLARTFQHEFEAPKPLIFYADHADFQQTNVLRGPISEGVGGVTEGLKNRVTMPLTGSYWDTDHVLGHELVHAFQFNLAQSRSSMGFQALAQLPLWVMEGMAEYLSVGREDPLTAMWLRDALLNNDIPSIQQLSSGRYFPYRFGQGLWAYIGGTYGDGAVVDLFRHSLRVGWDLALLEILGVSSDTLSARWRQAIAREYFPLLEGRTPPREVGTILFSPRTGSGRVNLAPSLSPDGEYIAFLSEREGFSIDLFLAETKTGKVVKTLSNAASDPHLDALRFLDSSGSWSPDGSQFAFVVFAEGDNQIVIVDVESGDVTRRIRVEGVGALSSPAWSPKGGRIAFSGVQGGISDLFVFEIETGEVRKLTDDREGDFQPTWSPDGKTLAFVSDRGPETDFALLGYGKFRLSFLELETGEVRHYPVFGNVKHINPHFSPDGASLYFISDQDGFSDIYRLRLATGEVYRVTRVATGVSGHTTLSPALSVASQTGTLAFSVFDQGEFHIYTLDRQDSQGGVQTIVQAERSPGRLLPPAVPAKRSRVASYLDDVRLGLVEPGLFSAAEAEDYAGGLRLDFIGNGGGVGVGTSRFGGASLSGAVGAYFSDMLGDRSLWSALSVNGGWKDIAGEFLYQNLKRRWNWGVGGGRTVYQRVRGGQGYNPQTSQQVYLIDRERVFLDRAFAQLSYPFSTTRRLEARIGVTRQSFDVEYEQYFTDPLGRTVQGRRQSGSARDPFTLGWAAAAIVGDNSSFGFASPVRGQRYRVEAQQNVGTVNFVQLTLDYRRYLSFHRNVTLAVRGLHWGRWNETSLANVQGGLFPFFLGEEPLMRGYAFESFDLYDCSFFGSDGYFDPGNTGCPEFDRLIGHRIAVANVELRIALLGNERMGLIRLPYVPTEMSFFMDAGLAWDASREPTIKFSRSRSERVPVMSVGISFRFNILNAFIFETYYAHPFQNSTAGSHWGFQLTPGW